MDQIRQEISQKKNKCKHTNDKTKSEDFATGHGQDMVDMDKIYIPIIGTANCLSIVSSKMIKFSTIVVLEKACCVR